MTKMIPTAWRQDEHQPVFFNWRFADLDLKDRQLAGIDLAVCDMQGTSFDRSDLSGATLGSVDDASFRGANLTRATLFHSSISDANFTETVLDDLTFVNVSYEFGRKPVGLAKHLVDCAQEVAPEPGVVGAIEGYVVPITARLVPVRPPA